MPKVVRHKKDLSSKELEKLIDKRLAKLEQDLQVHVTQLIPTVGYLKEINLDELFHTPHIVSGLEKAEQIQYKILEITTLKNVKLMISTLIHKEGYAYTKRKN